MPSLAEIVMMGGQQRADSIRRLSDIDYNRQAQHSALFANLGMNLANLGVQAVGEVYKAKADAPLRAQQATLNDQTIALNAAKIDENKTAKQKEDDTHYVMGGSLEPVPGAPGMVRHNVETMQKLAAERHFDASELINSVMQTNASLDSFAKARTSMQSFAALQAIKAMQPPGQPQTAVENLIKQNQANGVINDKDATAYLDLLQKDPVQFRAVMEAGARLSPDVAKELDATYQERPGETTRRVVGGQAISFTPPAKTEAKAGTVEDWVERARRLAVVNNNGQPLTDQQQQQVDQAAIQEFKTINTDPEVRAATLAQKNLALVMAQLQRSQIPTLDDAKEIAQAMVNNQLSPSQANQLSGRGDAGAAFKRMVTSEALKIDPRFNWEEAESTYQFGKSPQFQQRVRVMDSLLETIPRLQENAAKLQNSKVTLANNLVNLVKGGINDPTLKAFATDALLVSDEVAQLLGGGTGSATSDAKMAQGASIINTSMDVGAIKAAVDEINTLIGFRRSATTRGTYLDSKSAGADLVWDPVKKMLVKPGGGG